MRVRLGDRWVASPVADLRATAVDPEAVFYAIHGDGPDRLTVDCPPPGPAHEFVGWVPPDGAFSRRQAVAAAARSRGLAAPQDEAIARLRDERPAPAGASDLAALRRRVAQAREQEGDLRERVAARRGALRASREREGDSGEATAQFRSSARALAEAETERIAAEQALERARAKRRERLDRRERRLELTDRIENLTRAAREHLAAELTPRAERALADLPGTAATALSDATPTAARLAIARVASLRAPVVLAGDRFRGPWRAAAWLGAPVVRV